MSIGEKREKEKKKKESTGMVSFYPKTMHLLFSVYLVKGMAFRVENKTDVGHMFIVTNLTSSLPF